MTQKRLLVGLALVTLALTAGAQQAQRKSYIVELSDAPVAAYEGGVAGLNATRPARGNKLNARGGDARAYIRHLDKKRAAVTGTVPSARVLHRYNVTFNGFAASLTDAEVAKLATNPGVKSISADEALTLDTSYTPAFLGLTGPGGAWSRLDANGRNIKGEDIIIGVVDTGVWPENTSVSDKVDGNGKPVPSHMPGTVVYNPLPAGRFGGICQAGTDLSFTASHCNNKLIGARYYTAGVLAGGRTLWNTEFVSARDEDGHGSHTSSTAGGNEGSSGSVNGTLIPSFSGVAPRARLAMYKACWAWNNAGVRQGNCFTTDTLAGIDQAVADGVDVISYSISGSTTSYVDTIETAFKRAAYAGVFVAASAGNSNVFPGNASTVAHISPWLTTVGNSTHDRYTEATVTLIGAPGNGYMASGPSFQLTGVPQAPMILSTDAGFTGAVYTATQLTQLKQCYGAADGLASPLLDPSKVSGKILVCYRGGNAFVNKALNARTAGAVGYIAQNVAIATPPSGTTLFVVAAVIPMVHLQTTHEAQIFAHAAVGGMASFSAGVQVAGAIAPVMSGSSSRGPTQGDANMLKPDLTAPGTDIIAAYTNSALTLAERDAIRAGTLIPGSGTNMISGTSMAAPHVAGAGALMKQAYPGWNPAAIKSALMTSASPIVKLANGTADPSPWGYGSGHLNPNGALATTLVYDATPADFDRYIAKSNNSWDLNMASITRANVAGPSTVTRTLKNTGSNAVTYDASAAIPGFTVAVNPASLTIPAGGSASYTATITRTTAALETWSFGHLTWTEQGGSGKTVRSPLQAKGSLFVGVPLVTDTRAVGTKIFSVGTGWAGTMVTTPAGLVAATRSNGTSVLGQPEVCFAVAVPTGAQLLRVALFNADTQGGDMTDIDLSLYRKTSATARTLVGSSGSSTSDEWVMVTNPTASPTFGYEACVEAYAFAVPATSADFTLSSWVVEAPVGVQNLRAFGPSTVYLGGSATIGLSWNRPAGQRYLGNVQFRQVAGGTVVGNTAVYVDAVPAVPTSASATIHKIKELN